MPTSVCTFSAWLPAMLLVWKKVQAIVMMAASRAQQSAQVAFADKLGKSRQGLQPYGRKEIDHWLGGGGGGRDLIIQQCPQDCRIFSSSSQLETELTSCWKVENVMSSTSGTAANTCPCHNWNIFRKESKEDRTAVAFRKPLLVLHNTRARLEQKCLDTQDLLKEQADAGCTWLASTGTITGTVLNRALQERLYQSLVSRIHRSQQLSAHLQELLCSLL